MGTKIRKEKTTFFKGKDKSFIKRQLDRIDLHMEIPGVDYEKLSGDRGESPPNVSVPVHKRRVIFKVNVSEYDCVASRLRRKVGGSFKGLRCPCYDGKVLRFHLAAADADQDLEDAVRTGR